MLRAGELHVEYKRFDEDSRTALNDDVLGEYIAEVQKNAGVSVNQAALRRAIGGES